MNGTHLIPLPDGRILHVAEYGDPAGKPLLFLHGTPGSHLLGTLIDTAAKKYGYRVLAPDRPGIGRSTHDVARTYTSVARDMRAMLDALKLPQVYLVGISGGGPYALAMAHEMPERLRRVVLLSPWWFPHGTSDATKGLSLLFKAYAWLHKRAPKLTVPIAKLAAKMAAKAPSQIVKTMIRHAPADDKKLLADKTIQQQLADDVWMAFVQGWQGQWRETVLCFRQPSFQPHLINIPITIFHGAMDNVVPLHYAEKLTDHMQQAVLHIEPEGGHFVALRLMDAVFGVLNTPEN